MSQGPTNPGFMKEKGQKVNLESSGRESRAGPGVVWYGPAFARKEYVHK